MSNVYYNHIVFRLEFMKLDDPFELNGFNYPLWILYVHQFAAFSSYCWSYFSLVECTTIDQESMKTKWYGPYQVILVYQSFETQSIRLYLVWNSESNLEKHFVLPLGLNHWKFVPTAYWIINHCWGCPGPWSTGDSKEKTLGTC